VTEQELADRAGRLPERVSQLVGLGIVRAGADSSFRPSVIQRVRLADTFESSGIPIEDIAAVMASGHVTLSGLDVIFAEPVASLPKTFRELAEEIGQPPDVLRRLYEQLGLPQPADDERQTTRTSSPPSSRPGISVSSASRSRSWPASHTSWATTCTGSHSLSRSSG